LRRASAQAASVARERNLPLTLDPGWRELHFGAWDGLAPDTVDQSALARFWHDPQADPPPGGEQWSDLCARVAPALAKLESESLVVSHAGAIRAAVSLLTGLDHRGVWAFDLPYRALLTARIWPGEPLGGQVTGLVTDR
jgi:alpha-ribazole phosphatase